MRVLAPPPRPYRVPRLTADEVKALKRRLTLAYMAAGTAKTPQEWAVAEAERELVSKQLLKGTR